MSGIQTHTNGAASASTDGATPQTTNLPFTVADRLLVSQRTTLAQPTTFHLEAVRDYLRRLTTLQDPNDFKRTLDQLHVDFTGGVVTGRFLTPDGLSEEVLLLTSTGASQLAREVLPSRFFKGLKNLAHMDEQGAQLATLVWSKFGACHSRVRRIRTVRMQVEGTTQRVIRSCHSMGYAPYSNLQFVQDILDHAGDFAELPVLDWNVTDSGMRLRFAGIDGPTALVRQWDPNALQDEPVPMIECWNSEVGRRRVGVRGGMWRLVCANGMGHWDESTEWNWIHRGDPERIRGAVSGAFQNVLIAAAGVVQAYQQAGNVAIDDTFAWMEAELQRSLLGTGQVIAAARAGLTDATTTPGGKLASVVDAVTLIAQEEDIFGQYELERLAASMLKRGLSQSLLREDRKIVVGG